MIQEITKWLRPPIFPDDDDRTRIAGMLHVILVVFLCSTTFALLLAAGGILPITDRVFINSSIGITIAAVVGLLIILHKGYVHLVAWTFLLFQWASTVIQIIWSGGVESPVISGFITTILLAGFLISWQAIFVFAGVSIFSILGVWGLESAGLLPSGIVYVSQPGKVFIILTIVAGATVLLIMATRALNTALNNSRAHVKELSQVQMELIGAHESTIEGMVRALHFRDNETEEHTQRVTDLTEKLARVLNIPEGEILQMRRGALLHDIGKIGIPDLILLKAGPLTEEERRIIEKHTIYAYDILYSIPHLRTAIDIPYRHHERWDGNGYPGRLRGDQIPLAARLFAVVDVWDAIRNPRIFRKTVMSDKEAVAYLQREAGMRFDPRIVALFLDMELSQ